MKNDKNGTKNDPNNSNKNIKKHKKHIQEIGTKIMGKKGSISKTKHERRGGAKEQKKLPSTKKLQNTKVIFQETLESC